MKARWIIIAATAFVIIGAGQALTTEKLTTEAQETGSQAAEALASKSGCLECHSIDKKVVGPAYRDVAAKYREKADARATLIEKVKKGGKGNWTELTGGVPMPPHSPRLSDAEIKTLVDWVLSLEDIR